MISPARLQAAEQIYPPFRPSSWLHHQTQKQKFFEGPQIWGVQESDAPSDLPKVGSIKKNAVKHGKTAAGSHGKCTPFRPSSPLEQLEIREADLKAKPKLVVMIPN